MRYRRQASIPGEEPTVIYNIETVSYEVGFFKEVSRKPTGDLSSEEFVRMLRDEHE